MKESLLVLDLKRVIAVSRDESLIHVRYEDDGWTYDLQSPEKARQALDDLYTGMAIGTQNKQSQYVHKILHK